jgi:hypothetical protein
MNGRLDVQMDANQVAIAQMLIIIIRGSSRQGGLPRGGWRAENG